MSPGDLSETTQNIKWHKNDNILLGFESSDDAGIFRIDSNTALVQTLDFITPVVDDPYIFGQIAAANSLSDVFAMGGQVKTAMNIVCFDNCNIPKKYFGEILKGGQEKVKESGGVILGGHTINDLEMKYGLSVTGLVHPEKYTRNNAIKEGDVIVLTKPLGLGVITTSIKGDMASENAIKQASETMCQLNKIPAEIALKFGSRAMTDITGFGLIGHLYEMMKSGFTINVDFTKIPVIDEAYEYASMGLFPGGAHRNKKHYLPKIELNRELSEDETMMIFDPQTSGGLLIAVNESKADTFIERLHDQGFEKSIIIASVEKDEKSKILIN